VPARRLTSLPLVMVSVLLRVLSTLTVSDIWFSDPSLVLLSLTSEVFRLTPLPLFVKKVAHPLTSFGPPSETPFGAASRALNSELSSTTGSSSHEVLSPSSVQRLAGRHLSVSNPTPSPFSLSQTLGGLVPAGPYGLISYRCHS